MRPWFLTQCLRIIFWRFGYNTIHLPAAVGEIGGGVLLCKINIILHDNIYSFYLANIPDKHIDTCTCKMYGLPNVKQLPDVECNT